MNPSLYESTETGFQNNGIGILRDAITCKVKEERNGAFELEMTYPITGIHYEEIVLQRLILAKPNQTQQTQPFRIYRITKPMNGIVTVYAEHISYDLSGIAVSPFTAQNIQNAFIGLKQNAVGACPFTFTTDKNTQAKMTVSAPCSIRSQLGGKSGSILDVYGGGEYLFDRYSVRLYQNRGANHGVSIRYGKNLTDIKQEENCSKVYSAVYPYWVNSETGVVKGITGKIVNVSGTFPVQRILTYDLSQEFQTEPTEAQMIAKTQSYIANNNIGVPIVNLDVSFVQVEQSDEYRGMALLERVSLCDTVNVFFPKLGVNATAKAISLVYDVLLERVESIALGDAKTGITDSILAQESALKEVPTKNDVSAMVELLTSSILGANGGSVRLLDTNADGEPDTLYIADNPDPTKAVKVWRFNYQGWGASTNGYNGPFTLGASLNAGIVADFVTAGTLNAGLVKILGDTQFYWDSQNINIVNPNDTNQIIRIGKYNGTNYGIGFSKDGGKTWTDSMTFDGIIASSIGALEISANKITSGTLSTDRLAANSIAVTKLTGKITKTDVTGGTSWEINLTDGTLTIGSINADHITTGAIDATKVTVKNLDASKITTGTLSAERIAANSIAVGKLTGKITTTDVTGGTSWEINLTDGKFTIGNINADHITTGTIDATKVTVKNLDASKISTGTLNAERIEANSIAVSKLTGKIENGDWNVDLEHGTMSIGKLAVGSITGALEKTEVTGKTAWKIDFTNGTLTIGAISANNILAGTLSADRIAANSIAVGKLTGTITKTDVTGGTDWKIDLTNGSFTIGSIKADHITTGTIDASKVTVKNLDASKISTGTLSAERIAANSIAVGKLTGKISALDVTGQTAWEINLTDGTMTIGDINASRLKAGTISADRIGAASISLAKLAASSAFDGITKISGSGIEINATSIGASAKTAINADGLKVYDANGKVIGGLYKPEGQTATKMGSGSLFNTDYPNFSVQLERFFSGESMSYFYGMALYRKNTRICGLAAIDDDSVSDGALIGFNDDLVALNAIIDVVKTWKNHDPSQFVMSGESSGGTTHLIYAHGRANVSSSELRSVDYSAYGFTEIPTVVAQYSQEGSNISGDVGALKIYNKTTTGFNMIIGGAKTQPDRDIDWIAIGIGTGKTTS